MLCFSVGCLYAQPGSSKLDVVGAKARALMLSDTAYATEQSYRLTDDVKYDKDAKGYFALLSEGGKWDDIDYHSQARSAWTPSWHFYRLMLLVREYGKNKDEHYLAAIHKALKFWIANDLQCPNWWQNQINVPYAYSSLMLMLGDNASVDELAYLNNVLAKRVPQKNPTGQNKIWQHDIEARIALVDSDAPKFNTAIANMQAVISVSAAEGIQPDYSFQQHGTMLQFGNYGLHFINSLLFWITVTANTPFAFDKAQQQIIFDYCSKGIRWSVYRGNMDITAIGRQLRNNADSKRGMNLFEDFSLIRSFDSSAPCNYFLDGFSGAGQADCRLSGNKSFWRSDYMVQRAPNYMMSVKSHGMFVNKVESINSENLMGSFLNDGVTLVQSSGAEYHNIAAYWNWKMLPGTTSDTSIAPNSRDVFKTSNVAGFVGQVSDGKVGLSVMAYDRMGVKAAKSWFFVDDMMIALGAGISAPNMANVVTTVNQERYKAPLTRSGAKWAGLPWIWNSQTGYFFLDGDPHVLTLIDVKKQNWAAEDEASANGDAKDTLCSIYIPQHVKNSYAYAVKPTMSEADTRKLANKFPARVLFNTADIQAVKTDDVVMAVFYNPVSLQLSGGPKISCSAPCALICKSTEVWVADPTRKLKQLTLTINGQHELVDLPQGDMLGSSVRVGIR